jgi:hypothetical protein
LTRPIQSRENKALFKNSPAASSKAKTQTAFNATQGFSAVSPKQSDQMGKTKTSFNAFSGVQES